jgi:ABC-2 type transport system ATP-binding protein
MGIVPQDLAVYGDLTARENLWFFGGLYGLRGSALRGRIDATLDLVSLRQQSGQRVRTFSGGMKRRLNLAIGLLHEPSLLILDEPTVGVDPQSRSHVLARVRELANAGMAVVYASHYMEEVQAICDRALVLDHGRVLAQGRLETLLSRVHGVTTLHVAGPTEALRGALGPMAQVQNGVDGALTIVAGYGQDAGTADLGDLLGRLIAMIRSCDGRILSVESQESNLEQLFLELTGRHLRD